MAKHDEARVGKGDSAVQGMGRVHAGVWARTAHGVPRDEQGPAREAARRLRQRLARVAVHEGRRAHHALVHLHGQGGLIQSCQARVSKIVCWGFGCFASSYSSGSRSREPALSRWPPALSCDQQAHQQQPGTA